jgi:hypothetical protein
MANKSSHKGSAQKFGGPWTAMKVEMVVGYLEAFTTLLFNKPSSSRPFKRVYIDGFAGTGSFKFGAITTGFFKRDATEIAGSAQRALSIDPPFDALHFIEKRSSCLKALRKMTAGDRRVTIHDGDANAAIRKLCGEIDWGRTRGVIFLDPFGASLEWQSSRSSQQPRRSMFGISSRSARFLEMHHMLLRSSRQKSAPRSPRYSAPRSGKLNFIVNSKWARAFSI